MANPLASGFLIFVRRFRTVLLAPALIFSAISASGWLAGSVFIPTAQAQSKQQNPLEKARTTVETLINRLR